jgi:poly(3-hydroxybutyrate) depolymerase
MRPKLLLIRPYAGHTARLMERTVATLSKDFDVVMPDIPHETYAEYLLALRELVLEHKYIVGVCQGGVGVMMALGLQDGRKVEDKAVALLGSPIDVDAAPSKVSKFIRSVGAEYLVARYNLGGRINGGLITSDYMMLQPFNHMAKFVDYLYTGDKKIKSFYKMYFDTENMSRDFFRASIETTFIGNKNRFSKYTLNCGSKTFLIDYKTLGNTIKIFVAEGEKDEITAPGQTKAIYNVAPNVLDKNFKSVLVDSGHYGVFSGSKFNKEVYPKLVEFFLG